MDFTLMYEIEWKGCYITKIFQAALLLNLRHEAKVATSELRKHYIYHPHQQIPASNVKVYTILLDNYSK